MSKNLELPSIYAPYIPYVATANDEFITFRIPKELLGDAMANIAKSPLLLEFRLPEIGEKFIHLKIATPS